MELDERNKTIELSGDERRLITLALEIAKMSVQQILGSRPRDMVRGYASLGEITEASGKGFDALIEKLK